MGAEAFDHAYEDDLTDMKVCLQCSINLGAVRLTFPAESAIQISALNSKVDHSRQGCSVFKSNSQDRAILI